MNSFTQRPRNQYIDPSAFLWLAGIGLASFPGEAVLSGDLGLFSDPIAGLPSVIG